MGKDPILEELMQKVVRTAEEAQKMRLAVIVDRKTLSKRLFGDISDLDEPTVIQDDDDLSRTRLSIPDTEMSEAEFAAFEAELLEGQGHGNPSEAGSPITESENVDRASPTETSNWKAKAERKAEENSHETDSTAQAEKKAKDRGEAPADPLPALPETVWEALKSTPELIARVVAQTQEKPQGNAERLNPRETGQRTVEKQNLRQKHQGKAVRLNPACSERQKNRARHAKSKPSEKDWASQKALQQQADGKPAGEFEGKISRKTNPEPRTERKSILPPRGESPLRVQAPELPCLRRPPVMIWSPYHGQYLDKAVIKAQNKNNRRKAAERRAEAAAKQAETVKRRDETAAKAAKTARR